jgi:hypothetical protein
MQPLLLVIMIIISALVFNPYVAWKQQWQRTSDAAWRTRERSYGWPFYAKRSPKWRCSTNPQFRQQRLVKNVIYVE